MIRIEESIVIARPPAEVFRTAADPFRQLDWDHQGMREVKALSLGGLKRGARYRGSFKGFGTVEYEFVEYEPDRRFAHLAKISVGVMRHAFTFQATPEGTRMTQVGELAPNLLGRIAGPVFKRKLKDRFRTIGDEMKRYLYAGGGREDH